VAAGLSNKQVAEQLYVSVYTVEARLSKAYAKPGIGFRTRPWVPRVRSATCRAGRSKTPGFRDCSPTVRPTGGRMPKFPAETCTPRHTRCAYTMEGSRPMLSPIMPALKRRARRWGLQRPADYKIEPMPRMRWYT